MQFCKEVNFRVFFFCECNSLYGSALSDKTWFNSSPTIKVFMCGRKKNIEYLCHGIFTLGNDIK